MMLLAPLAAAGCGEPVPVPLTCTETIEVDDTAGWVGVFSGGSTYDSPEFPWYSLQKAESLREAVLDALPRGTEVEALDFGPLMVDSTDPTFDGIVTSWSNVETARGRGTIYVSVEKFDDPLPPCIEDYTLFREQLADGTILEHSLEESDESITYNVTAYKPDGSRVIASSTNYHTGQGTMTDTFADEPALSHNELTRIATAPGMDTQPLDE